jgi:hypothetical protein
VETDPSTEKTGSPTQILSGAVHRGSQTTLSSGGFEQLTRQGCRFLLFNGVDHPIFSAALNEMFTRRP